MKKALLSFPVVLLLASCAGERPETFPLPVVQRVDLQRYSGRWYEIASFPQRFQKGCTDTRADYRLLNDGTIKVLNSCFRDGKVDTARGKAWVVDRGTNAKLKVSFFWPFRGDYWIIELGEQYEYSVVSAPSGRYLWILAREPRMDETVYTAILGRLRERGFDTGRLRRTEHGNRSNR